jgi:hypothetical protein
MLGERHETTGSPQGNCRCSGWLAIRSDCVTTLGLTFPTTLLGRADEVIE